MLHVHDSTSAPWDPAFNGHATGYGNHRGVAPIGHSFDVLVRITGGTPADVGAQVALAGPVRRRSLSTSTGVEAALSFADRHSIRIRMRIDKAVHRRPVNPGEVPQRPSDRFGDEELRIRPVSVA